MLLHGMDGKEHGPRLESGDGDGDGGGGLLFLVLIRRGLGFSRNSRQALRISSGLIPSPLSSAV